jgi:peptidoglycan/xylan/chitin deacetylase (PgdA/CDA1 family)
LPGVNSIVTIPSALRTPEFESMHRQLLNFAAAAHYDADQKQAYARAIAETLEVDFDAICTQRILHNLNPDEVRALDPNRVSVQLHTHRHRTPSTLEDVQEELTRNGAEIHSMTGRHDRLKHFCYPSGRYSPEFVDWLNTHGVASATTCEPGLATRATERLAIPRFIDTMGVSTDTFMAWVSGTAAFTQFGRATDGAAPEGGAADDPRAATAHVPSSHIFTTPPTTAPASVSKSQTRA